jgi:hypothetical protein
MAQRRSSMVTALLEVAAAFAPKLSVDRGGEQ